VLILHARHESIVLPESAEILTRAVATPPEATSIVWFEKTDHQIFCDCERKAAVDAAVRFVANRISSKPHNP
jgi:carboxylesterase